MDVLSGLANDDGDLWADQEADYVALHWDPEAAATEYIVLRSDAIGGPWAEICRRPADRACAVDLDTEARLRARYYRVQALLAGRITRQYVSVYVAPTAPLRTSPWPPLSALERSAAEPPYNVMCLADDDLVDGHRMSEGEVRSFIRSQSGSFLNTDRLRDVTGDIVDPAEVIAIACATHDINPQVLLTLLQRESQVWTTPLVLSDRYLRHILNYDPQGLTITEGQRSFVEEVFDTARNLRRNYDRITILGIPTIGNWFPGKPHPSTDNPPLTVTPSNTAVAVLFQFDTEVGAGWGGQKGVAGNAAFCSIWRKYGFEKAQIEFALQDLKPTSDEAILGGAPIIPQVTVKATGSGDLIPSDVSVEFFSNGVSIGAAAVLLSSVPATVTVTSNGSVNARNVIGVTANIRAVLRSGTRQVAELETHPSIQFNAPLALLPYQWAVTFTQTYTQVSPLIGIVEQVMNNRGSGTFQYTGSSSFPVQANLHEEGDFHINYASGLNCSGTWDHASNYRCVSINSGNQGGGRWRLTVSQPGTSGCPNPSGSCSNGNGIGLGWKFIVPDMVAVVDELGPHEFRVGSSQYRSEITFGPDDLPVITVHRSMIEGLIGGGDQRITGDAVFRRTPPPPPEPVALVRVPEQVVAPSAPETPVTEAIVSATPNPFRDRVAFGGQWVQPVELAVIDLQGRTVFRDRFVAMPAWNGKDACGRRVSQGLYLVRLTSGDVTRSTKVVCLP